MSCDLIPIREDMKHVRCKLRKGHKGMCQRTLVESWYGRKEE